MCLHITERATFLISQCQHERLPSGTAANAEASVSLNYSITTNTCFQNKTMHNIASLVIKV